MKISQLRNQTMSLCLLLIAALLLITGCGSERIHPDVLTSRHHLETWGHESAIECVQAGDVGHGPKRHQVEQVD